MEEEMLDALRQRIQDDFKTMIRTDYPNFQKVLKSEFRIDSEKDIANLDREQLLAIYSKTNAHLNKAGK